MARVTTKLRWRAWVTALPLCAILGLIACGGDGCGGDPNAQKSSPPPSSGGGAGPSSGGGGGEVNVADWDGNQGAQQQQAAPPQQPPQQQPASPTAPEQTKTAPLDEITKPDWGGRVLKSAQPVFVLVTGRTCPDCDLVSPILRQLAPDFPKWSFYRLDGGNPDSKALLPQGMTPLPLPAFVIYDQGFARSRRQGLPIPRKKGELEVDYQTRLSKWFRDALTQKTFAFAKK